MGTERKNIEWDESRPGIYKVNCACPDCKETRHFAGPDITMHQVLMGLREMGWVITRRYDQPGMKIYCSTSCAKKGGAILGAQVKAPKPTGKVKLSDGRVVDLADAPEAAAETPARKRRKPARKKPRRKAAKAVRSKRQAESKPVTGGKSQLRFTMD